jgi:CubicO group peptidase (beta-lactamase class C family)
MAHVRQLVLVLLVLALAVPAHAQSAPLEGFDAYVERTMKTFNVPGVAVAIVKDGKVVHAKGYGVRKVGEAARVDERTLFGIASNTKAFTTAALAMLAEEGKLSWDDPVVSHLPEFQMHDPYVTREMRIRDLVTHRSGLGLGAGDLLVFPETTYTRDEIVRRIRHLRPVSSFRTKYDYDNLLYLVAGQIIPAVTGKSWDDFVRERILVPLGMTDTATTIAALHGGTNVAAPHSVVDGSLRAIRAQGIDNAGPAASINSSVADLAKWMIVQLDAGSLTSLKPGSEARLFSAASSREMWTPQTILPLADPPPGFEAMRSNFAAYGLGWVLNEYHGHKVASHTGGLSGYVSKTTLIPGMKIGVVVLTNQEEGAAFQAISLRAIDAMLGRPETDWVALYAERRRKQVADAEASVGEAGAKRAASSKPSLPIEKYAGVYRDPWRDDVTIALESGKLVMRFPRTELLVGDLEHWQYDTFVARWRDRSLHADAYVTFSLKPDGTIDEMKMLPVSPLTDFSFDFQDLLFRPVVEKK